MTEGRRFRGAQVVGAVIALLGALTLGAIVAPTLAMRGKTPELPIYGAVPAFSLQAHTGDTITNRDLLGKVVVMNFIFTRCPTVCPMFSMKMRRVQDRTADLTGDLKLLSLTVDPQFDTAAVLSEYATVHGADPARWRFVTGPFETMRKVVSEGLMMAMESDGTLEGGVPNIVHSEHFVLIDPRGQIRGYYHSGDAVRVERMLRDARRLVRAP